MEAGAKIRVRPAVPLDIFDILVVRIASWRERGAVRQYETGGETSRAVFYRLDL